MGKTGIKEALRHCLERQAPTCATKGNLNNKWGLPLSLARMPRTTTYGIFEVGMNAWRDHFTFEHLETGYRDYIHRRGSTHRIL